MKNAITVDIVGTLLAGKAPHGVPAHVIEYPRWTMFANSSTRRYRGERHC